jgi:hypothetical protein
VEVPGLLKDSGLAGISWTGGRCPHPHLSDLRGQARLVSSGFSKSLTCCQWIRFSRHMPGKLQRSSYWSPGTRWNVSLPPVFGGLRPPYLPSEGFLWVCPSPLAKQQSPERKQRPGQPRWWRSLGHGTLWGQATSV